MATFPTFYHHGTLVQTPYIEEITAAFDPTIRTETEAGYVISRARFTRTPRRWRLRFDMMTEANRATLRTFEIARSGGSEAFVWTDPNYVVTNLLANPGFELPGYTASGNNIPGWTRWGAPIISQTNSTFYYAGLFSLYQYETVSTNSGREQTIPCIPSSPYTFTAWVWRSNTVSPTIRIMSYDGVTYYTTSSPTWSAWHQLSLAMTTAAAQTSLTLWIGGKGNAYFDNVSASTPNVSVRFLEPVVYIPVAGTNNTRWTVNLVLEEQ